MTVRLVSDAADSLPGVDDHDLYLQLLSLAVDDPSYVPLVLHSETRRGISVALSELLLYCGRAQPTPQLHLRAPLRNESGRVVVALRETRQTLMVFAAEQLHHLDVYLFSNIAERAGVDLWLVPQSRLPRMTRTACERVGAAETSLREALAKLTSSDSRGRRREPDPCAGALQLGGDLSDRCEEHEHAGQCAVAAFPHALVGARATPTAVRHRLHELSRHLPDEQAWDVLSAARDPYLFVERALVGLDLTGVEQRALRIADVAADGSRLALAGRSVVVPEYLRALMRRHREIRIEDGSGEKRPYLIPHDDGHRRNWSALPALAATSKDSA